MSEILGRSSRAYTPIDNGCHAAVCLYVLAIIPRHISIPTIHFRVGVHRTPLPVPRFGRRAQVLATGLASLFYCGRSHPVSQNSWS